MNREQRRALAKTYRGQPKAPEPFIILVGDWRRGPPFAYGYDPSIVPTPDKPHFGLTLVYPQMNLSEDAMLNILTSAGLLMTCVPEKAVEMEKESREAALRWEAQGNDLLYTEPPAEMLELGQSPLGKDRGHLMIYAIGGRSRKSTSNRTRSAVSWSHHNNTSGGSNVPTK